MILALAAGVALAAAAYFAVKHYGSAAIVAAVKAEVAKIESEIPKLVAEAPSVVKDIVARLKALL